LKFPGLGATFPGNSAVIAARSDRFLASAAPPPCVAPPPSRESPASVAALHSAIRHRTRASFNPSADRRGSAPVRESFGFGVTSPGGVLSLLLRSQRLSVSLIPVLEGESPRSRSTADDSPLIAPSDRLPMTAPPFGGASEDLALITASAAPAGGWRLSPPVMIGAIVGVFVLARAIAALVVIARRRKRDEYSYEVSGNSTEAVTETVPSQLHSVSIWTGVNILTATDLGTDVRPFQFDADEEFFH
jgi:hypothetical protein